MTAALIFDMDGTMIDSMKHHAQSWAVFAQHHGLSIDLPDLMRRTTGRTGAECMRELFQRPLSDAQAWALIHEKEAIYRELFGPVFKEVDGFSTFCAQARARGFKIGVGTAGDRHNIAFALEHLALETAPDAIVGGDEGHPGKPDPAIFLAVARQLNTEPHHCIVFEDAPFGLEAARRAGMRAVALCTSHPESQLTGPHVLTSTPDYRQLLASDFLENLHVATA